MVIWVILTQGLSLTLHVYEFLCFFFLYMDLHSLRNKLRSNCRIPRHFMTTSFTRVGVLWRTRYTTIVAILIQWDANKWRGILQFSYFILLQTKIWGVFWLDIFFKKFCFLTNKYRHPASTETTSLVINAHFIGFDQNTWNAQEVCATWFESRAIIEAEAEYFNLPFHIYFTYRLLLLRLLHGADENVSIHRNQFISQRMQIHTKEIHTRVAGGIKLPKLPWL